jgi:FSR family fosmidomycin resistance protein-like MFS transporter
MAVEARPLGDAGMQTNRQGIGLLSLAHLVNDANQSALPAIIPWLVSHRDLSLAAAASLVLAMNLSSSVVQPLFGHLSDRRSMIWVIPVAMFVGTAGVAMIGLAPTLPLMLGGALVSGIGVAAFHPESSRFSNYFAGAKRAAGMGWFTVGGYLGLALGPIVVTPLLLAFGLRGTAALLFPAAIVATLLWREMPRFADVRREARRSHREREAVDDWRGFSALTLTVGLRSVAFLAAVTFMPVFAIRVTHVDAPLGSAALAALLLAGASGTVWGGQLADRIDRRRVISLSLFLTASFGIAMVLMARFAPFYPLLVLLAVCYGVSIGLSAGVVVVLGQEYLPKRIGVASGVTLGLAVTVGGLAAPLFGAIGDRYGLPHVLATAALCTLLAFLASFLMPRVAASGIAAERRAIRPREARA